MKHHNKPSAVLKVPVTLLEDALQRMILDGYTIACEWGSPDDDPHNDSLIRDLATLLDNALGHDNQDGACRRCGTEEDKQ